MTTRFLHIRECDEDGEILNTGGATIAYSVSPEMGAIFLNISRCSVNDQFCKQTGREVAAKRLFEDGPHEILTLQHPITKTIGWWFIRTFGFPLIRTANGKWISTFEEPEPPGDLGMYIHERLPDASFLLEDKDNT